MQISIYYIEYSSPKLLEKKRKHKKKMSHDHHHHQSPCLHCNPSDYIRMVQHLIERCLLFQMSREECMNTLANQANIDPVVTLTVWKELLKENKGFFQEYFQSCSSSKN